MKQLFVFVGVFLVSIGSAFADIPSISYVSAIDETAVHKTGNETVGGDKTFTGDVVIGEGASVTLTTDVASDNDSNQLTTTKWANAKIESAKGDIPVGSRDATTYTKIWLEN